VPGIVGIAARSPERVADGFEAMLGRMRRHGVMNARVVSTADGCVLAAEVFRSKAPQDVERHTATSTGAVLLHGVLYNGDELRRRVSSGAESGSPLPDLLSALYTAAGTAFVNDLRGEFALAIVDPERRRLHVCSDLAANYPIYWCADQQGLVFSSDLSALLRGAAKRPVLDLRAVADYLTIGTVLEDKTLAVGVRALPPASVLTYDVDAGTASVHPYVELAAFFDPKTSSRADYLEQLKTTFKTAVDRALTGGRQCGLSLSGGLDSRALLSASNGRSKTIRTYTLGVEGCADQVIAERLSRIAGTQHRFFALDDTYLRDFLPNMAHMVSLTDGMYLSHGLTEMLALRFLDETGIEVLLRGHGGELAKAHLAWPLHTDAHVYQLASSGAVADYLSERANYITPGLPLSAVLTPKAAEAAGAGSKTSFANTLRDTRLSPAEACSYLYLREHHRRFTVPSLELFRTSVDVRLPYVDRDFLRVLLAAPPEWRDTTAIHQALTATGLPALLKVRNSNTGAAADAAPRVEFVLDKFNTLFKRLNVRGFRHYHNFDGWMRTMLLESVEAELLGPAARLVSFVDRTALARLIEATRSQQADHAYLLQVLLILELWQRENDVEAAA
jgi:asparagine synthase (glutamine-hydrolysing)